MRFKHFGILILSAVLVLSAVACGADTEEQKPAETEEQEQADIGGEAPQLEDIEFIEIDRTNLTEDTIIATFEGGEVRGDQFATFLAFHGFINPETQINDDQLRQELIRFYILQEVISKKAEMTDWVTEKTEEFWEQFTTYYDEETRQRAYDTLQITEEEIKEQLNFYFITENYFREQISETELQASYEELKGDLTTASVRHILISFEGRSEEEAKALADDLYQQLQEGADLAELAKEYSDDGNAETGGAYEDVPVGQWVPEFKQAALEQEVGVIGQPIKTQFGYHIVRVEDRSVASLEEIKDPLIGKLANEKIEAYFTQTLPGLIKEINI
jgi:foldase protein PrsA